MSDLRQRTEQSRLAFDPPKPTEPPQDTGKRLATIERVNNKTKQKEELRVSWCEYEGRPYLSIRLWSENNSGWWPTKTGCTVRTRELHDFADGISAALDELDEHHASRLS